jgi:hypothetical protein
MAISIKEDQLNQCIYWITSFLYFIHYIFMPFPPMVTIVGVFVQYCHFQYYVINGNSSCVCRDHTKKCLIEQNCSMGIWYLSIFWAQLLGSKRPYFASSKLPTPIHFLRFNIWNSMDNDEGCYLRCCAFDVKHNSLERWFMTKHPYFIGWVELYLFRRVWRYLLLDYPWADFEACLSVGTAQGVPWGNGLIPSQGIGAYYWFEVREENNIHSEWER